MVVVARVDGWGGGTESLDQFRIPFLRNKYLLPVMSHRRWGGGGCRKNWEGRSKNLEKSFRGGLGLRRNGN